MSPDSPPPESPSSTSLAELQEKHLRDAEEAYLAGDAEAAKLAVERWETGRALKRALRSRTARYGPLVVAAAAGVVLLLGASIPVPGAVAAVDAVVGGATIELGGTYDWDGPVVVGSVVVSGIGTVAGAGGVPHDGRLELAGSDVRLESLRFGAGTVLELDRPARAMNVFVTSGLVEAGLSIRRGTLWADDRSVLYDLPEHRPRQRVTVSAAPTTAGEPFALSVSGGDELALQRLPVSGVALVEEVTPNSGDYRPAIRSGAIDLPDVDRAISLSPTSSVRIELADTARLSIWPAEGGFRITLVGRADELAVGPAGHERSRIPRILEFVARSQRIAFLWTTAAFLLGLGWSLWKWFV